MDPRPGADGSDPDDAARLVIAQVAELASVLRPDGEPPAVSEGTHLEADLGFDSLTVAELLVRLEAASGSHLPDGALAEVATVGDLLAAFGIDTARASWAGASRGGASRASATWAGVSPADGGDRAGVSGASCDARAGRRAAGPGVAPSPRQQPRPLTSYGVYARIVFALLGALVWLLVVLVPGLLRRWRIVRAAGHLLFEVTGTPVRVEGQDRLPAGGYIVVANHASFLDPLLLAMVLPAPVTFTGVEGLQEHAVARIFLRRLRVEPVPRSADRRRGVAVAGVLTRLATQGRRVVFFPEGRRSPRSGIERFHMGAFVAAADAGVPVVPVAIRGTRAILPVDARWPRRSAVEVVIGPPSHATRAGFTAAADLHHRARRWLLDACDEPDVSDLPHP